MLKFWRTAPLLLLVLSAGILCTETPDSEEPTQPKPHEGPYTTNTYSSLDHRITDTNTSPYLGYTSTTTGSQTVNLVKPSSVYSHYIFNKLQSTSLSYLPSSLKSTTTVNLVNKPTLAISVTGTTAAVRSDISLQHSGTSQGIMLGISSVIDSTASISAMLPKLTISSDGVKDKIMTHTTTQIMVIPSVSSSMEDQTALHTMSVPLTLSKPSKDMLSTSTIVLSHVPSSSSVTKATATSLGVSGIKSVTSIKPTPTMVLASPSSSVVLPTVKAPTGPPEDVKINNVSAHKIQLTWKPPLEEKRNGIILRYVIRLNTSFGAEASYSTTGNRTDIEVAGLRAYTPYSITVQAENAGGLGPVSTPLFQTTLETIPTEPRNVLATSVNSTTIRISWDEPQFPNGEIEYHLFYRQLGDEEMQPIFSGAAKQFVVTGLKQFAKYEFKVVAFNIKLGKSGPNRTIIARTSSAVPPGPPRNVEALVQSSTSVLVQWLPPSVGNGDIVNYTVKYNSPLDQQSSSSVTTLDDSTFLLITGLKPYTMYYFTVHAMNSFGLGPGSEPGYNRTSEEVPGAPSFDTVRNVSSSVLRVVWNPPVNENGKILGYLLCWTLLSSGTPDCNKTAYDQRNFNIRGLIPYSLYNISLSAETSIGFGPTVSGVYRTAEGFPSSPRSPQGWNTSATTIFVKWEAPYQVNGILKHYQVEVTKEDNVVSTESTEYRNITLKGLAPYTTYTIRINAVTGAGGGNAVNIRVTTDESAPSAVFRVKFTVVESTYVNITWLPPKAPNGKIGYYVAYWTKNKPHMYLKIQVPSGRTWCLVKDLESVTVYTFSVIPYNLMKLLKGPSVNKSVSTATGVPSGPPLNVKVTHQDSREIGLSWSKPAKPNGVIVHYIVRYHLATSSKPEKDVTHLMHREVQNLHPFREYILQVTAATSKGPGPYSKELSVWTSPDKPPPMVTVRPPADHEISANSFILELVEASSENGLISYYQVVVLELTTDRIDAVIQPSEKPDSFRPDALLTYEEAEQLKYSNKPYIAAEFGASDFEKYKIFKVGGGDMSSFVSRNRRNIASANRTGYYNGPLKENTFYTVFQRAYVNKDLYTSGSWIEPVATAVTGKVSHQRKPINAPLVAGLTAMVIIFAICVIVIGYYFRRKRRSPDIMLDDQTDALTRGQQMRLRAITRRKMRSQTGKARLMGSTDSLDELEQMALLRQSRAPVPIDDFEAHVERNHVDGDIGFSEEYEVVEPDMEFSWVHSLNPVNKYKNRYANIVAYDHSRVMLSPVDGVPGSDYINANYIDGFNRSGEYIATQGTLPETFDDFWRMLWEQESATIVMLTNLEEKGRRKCDQYWPEDGCTEIYGKINVTHTSSHDMSSYVMRTFAVRHEDSLNPDDERLVKQFHFISWPDHGVPTHATPVLSFVRHVSRSNPPCSGPVVVHCSAGVGRTGTFIAIDSLLQSILKEDTVDVFGFVRQMRTKRNLMVQTEAQYVFIHDALLEAITCGITEVHANDLLIRIRELRRVDGETGLTFMEKEFLRLTHEQKNPLVFKSATQNYNTLKNRFANILPFESTRVKLEMQPGIAGSDYINANYLDGYCQPRAFIATQAPVPETIHDFWRMIWEQDCGGVMMLTREQEGGKLKCHRYWPREEPMRYGAILVELVDERAYSDYVMREFQMTHTEIKSTRIIRQFQYTGWPDVGLPESGTGIIDLIGQLQKWQQHSGNKTIVVHCSGGVGRTGVFIAISSMIERMKTEGVIDVFQTVQSMRLRRPAMVQTKEQYEFCYTTLQEYLDSFDLYANFQ